MSLPDVRSLRVALFGGDHRALHQRASSLGEMQTSVIQEVTALEQSLRAGQKDVLVFIGEALPKGILESANRPAIVWLAPRGADGSVEAILPAEVSAAELRECVELVGSRAVLWREIERLAEQVEQAFGRNKWRGGALWRSPAELVQMATTDPLTGVYNRRYLERSLEVELERHGTSATPLSVLLLDLDDFKPINDQFGHRTGDIVLRQVAARLRRATRGSDVVCRYGGDEFAVVAPDSDARSAAILAERLHQAIDESPFETEGPSAHISCSLGVASTRVTERVRPDELIHRADLAMLAAKRAGGDTVREWSELSESDEAAR